MKLNGNGNLRGQKKRWGGAFKRTLIKGGLRWQKGNGRCTQEDFGKGGLEWQSGNGGWTLEDYDRGGLRWQWKWKVHFRGF